MFKMWALFKNNDVIKVYDSSQSIQFSTVVYFDTESGSGIK